MKKLAIMASGIGTNFEAIVKYFKNKDIEITCLSNIKDAPVLQKAENMGILQKHLPFEENSKYFEQNKFDLIALAGYMKILQPKTLALMGKVINLHPSLLPSFKGQNAIKKAFLSGVKISGVSVHWVSEKVDEGKIIAQYPVFISNYMHFDEFEAEIHSLEHKLYPIVIDSILNDKVFDFADLLKSNCGGGCNSCKS